jgi:hypothetical protein
MARNNEESEVEAKLADGAEAGLTEAEIERLTDETVDLLLKAGGGEAQEWIEKGRIIHEYVGRLQPNGKFSKPDPFALLAGREDIPWRTSQLRTYRDAYLLWQKVGGEDGAPKVEVTTVGLVLSLDDEAAKKVLKRAVKEKLTTRQVAALVKKEKGKEATERTERVTGDWKALGKAAERLNAEASLMIECPPAGSSDLGVVQNLEVALKAITELIEKVNTPGWGPK